MDWGSLPPLAAIRAFSAFADKGGVEKAGQALNVSHAAVSQQIRHLERHLGAALLDRTGRAMTLTEDGKRLASAALNGFSEIAQAVEQLTGAEAARPVYVTTTSSFAGYWLMPRLAQFRTDHPEINVMVDPSPQIAQLGAAGADVAIRYGNGDWPGAEATLLVDAPVVCVAAPSLVGQTPPKDLAELGNFPWFEELGRYEASDWLAKHNATPKAGVTTAPGHMTLDLVRRGQGIAILARLTVEEDLAAGRLICLHQDPQPGGYWIVTPTGVLRPAVKAFVNWLKRAG